MELDRVEAFDMAYGVNKGIYLAQHFLVILKIAVLLKDKWHVIFVYFFIPESLLMFHLFNRFSDSQCE